MNLFETKTYIEVWESDLSEFVSEFYGRPWRMQQGEMLSQNTYKIIDVSPDGTEWDEPEDSEKILQSWLALPYTDSGWEEDMRFERDNYLDVDVVLWDLCRKGIAPEGKYLITVWW